MDDQIIEDFAMQQDQQAFEQDQQELEFCLVSAIQRCAIGLSTLQDAKLLANFCRVQVPGVSDA